MQTVQYELTCPHCGLKYTYDMEAGDPSLSSLPLRCIRCGQSEPTRDYYRMNCIPQEKPAGVYTTINQLTANPGGQTSPVFSEDCGTVLMSGTGMTTINKAADPHRFRHPGTLINVTSGESVTLMAGEQVVGRLAKEDGPEKGLSDPTRTASRRHVCITCCECGDGSYIHTVLNRNNKNRTLLDGKLLPAGAIWKMSRGAKLTMGMLEVTIEDI